MQLENSNTMVVLSLLGLLDDSGREQDG